MVTTDMDDATDTAASEQEKLLYLRQFLGWARGLDLLDEPGYRRLVEQVDRRAATLAAAATVRTEHAAGAAGPSPTRPDSAVAALPRPEVVPSEPLAALFETPPPAAPPPAAAPEAGGAWPAPGGIGRSVRRLRDLVASDMGVHGLSYLGVLLTFAGTFGFVFFAFGSLRSSLRPVAEVALPAVFFASAWFLRTRDAVLVANSLELVGGALVPVVVFASLVDGAAVPPDPTGGALVAALTISAALIAVAYGLWAITHPSSALRYLAAPVGWLAAMAAGFALSPGTLSGIEIEQPSAAQLALGCLAISGTLAVAARFRGRPLADASTVSAVPGSAAAFALTLAIAAGAGWPWAPAAIASGATVVSLEFLMRRFGGVPWITALQCVVIGIGAAALAVQVGAGWAGAIAALCFVGLLEGRRIGHAPEASMLVPAAGAAAGLAVALLAWQAALVAWSAAALWVNVLRARPAAPAAAGEASPEGAPTAHMQNAGATALDAAAAVLPLGVAAALLQGLPSEWAWIAIGGALVAGASAARAFARDDPLWRWWFPAAGLAACAGIAVARDVTGARPGMLTAAAAACTAALTLAPSRAAVRAWSTAVAGALTVYLGLLALGVPVPHRPGVWAAASLAVVLASAPLGRRSADRAVRGHWSMIGHLGATAALLAGVAVGGTVDRLFVWGCWIAVWSLDLVLGEAGRPAVPVIVPAPGWTRETDREAQGTWSRIVPALVLVVSLPAAVFDLARSSALVARNPSTEGLLVAAVGIALTAAARTRRGADPSAAVFAHGGVAVTAAAFPLALADALPTAIVALLAVGAVALLEGRLRAAIEEWFAWASSAVGTVAFASGLGVPHDRLRDVLAVWGAVSVVGAFAADDLLRGRRSAGAWIRTRWLSPGAVLGVAGAVLGAVSVVSAPPRTFAVWALAGAGLAFVVAVQARVGAVTAIGYALAVVGAAELGPQPLVQNPWTFVPMAGALVGISWLLSFREAPGAVAWLRWDLPPLVVAHAVALAALTLSLFTPSSGGAEPTAMLVTWLGFGALSFVVWAWRRRPVWEISGQVLVLGGVVPRGPSVAAAAFGAAAVWNAVADRFTPAHARMLRRVAVAGLVAGAWGELMVARALPLATVARATALVSGVVAIASSAGVRFRRLDRTWAGPFAAVAAMGLATSVALATTAGPPSTWMAIAAGTALAALAAGISAAPLGVRALRPLASVLAVAAAAALVRAHPGSASLRGLPFVAASLVVSLVTLWLWRRNAGTVWLPSLSLLSALTGVAGVVVAATAWPEASMLVAALAALGVECAVAGVALRQPAFVGVSAGLLCSAWVLFADRALPGNPEWFAVPIGIAVLIVADAIRWDARLRRATPPTAVLVPIEFVGILFLAVPSLVQIVAVSPAYVFVSVAIGAGVMAWGGVTRVRRRVVAGAAIPLVAVVLVIAAPIAHQIHEFRDVALWAGLAAVGIAFIVAATFLERGRAKVRAAAKRLRDATEGWE
ncbi:MAG TPA: hypothetical protein VEM41_05020 [Actinomycetota bacterium]|nr:hypothetical protein [Actinomycetota bacterium]